jgi:4-hydroxybenzoate polyprenyltransferase
MIFHYINALRPRQWTKNIVVFAGLMFAKDIYDPYKLKIALNAFILFCIVSSAGYLINDVNDKASDALHPRKRNRPVASGKVPEIAALVIAAFLFFFAIFAALVGIHFHFARILALYSFLTVLYSIFLKKVIILDIMAIAAGFILRTLGGAIAIQVYPSSWLIICALFLALFLALNKRKAELLSLGDTAGQTRTTLRNYSVSFLNQMSLVITSACLMSYALYTLDGETVMKFGTRGLALTLPFVVYGLFRYLYLVEQKQLGEAPEEVMTKDAPIMLCVILFVLATLYIIYF